MKKLVATVGVSLILIMACIPVTTSQASDVEAEKRVIQQQINEVESQLVEAKRQQRIAESSQGKQEIKAAKVNTRALKLKLAVLKNNYVKLVDKSNGKITRKIADGTYFGEVNKDGLKDGVGQAVWDNGSKYLGDWRNGKISGTGKYIYASGSYYEGSFVDDAFSGEGVYVTKDGGKYKGTFENDQIIKGSYKEKNYSYVGEFENFKLSGYGLLKTNGETYTGLFSNNQLVSGTVNYADGSKFTGKLIDGKASGYGKLTKKDGKIVKGYFKEGKFSHK
ncbi:MAG: hypothetical protein KBT36_03950 [Kurthia sp.]|nr:hypothetical protein [Candidatus Kurthia equi]